MVKPAWLTIRPTVNEKVIQIRALLREGSLHTVCEEAHCPNLHECWSSGTATFMILGDICTRGCRFCTVTSGTPLALDPDEPKKLVQTARQMNLDYVVLTSVDRDDLEDQGAGHFAQCIRALRRANMRVEALIPDFQGNLELVEKVVRAKPDVLDHNLETVRRLQPTVRDRRANYEQSLSVLRHAKSLDSNLYTKSSLLLGLGESEEEIVETMREMRDVGVSILVLCQYLQPSKRHLPIERYVTPAEFKSLRKRALDLGFTACVAGPLVRTSYRAAEVFSGIRAREALLDRQQLGASPLRL